MHTDYSEALVGFHQGNGIGKQLFIGSSIQTSIRKISHSHFSLSSLVIIVSTKKKNTNNISQSPTKQEEEKSIH